MSTETDKNWNHASETAEMLRQATAHIQLSMHEGQDSIESLTSSFNAVVEHLNQVTKNAEALEDGAGKQSIQEDTRYCIEQANAAVVSMQFYDTLTQRLEFIAESLQALSDVIKDKERRRSEAEWLALQNDILQRCHIQADVVFLDAIRAGQSFDEAHRLSKDSKQQDQDIELF
jgi:hypothetical protein